MAPPVAALLPALDPNPMGWTTLPMAVAAIPADYAAVRTILSYLLAASLRCQPGSVAGVTGKTPAQRPRGTSSASLIDTPVTSRLPVCSSPGG